MKSPKSVLHKCQKPHSSMSIWLHFDPNLGHLTVKSSLPPKTMRHIASKTFLFINFWKKIFRKRKIPIFLHTPFQNFLKFLFRIIFVYLFASEILGIVPCVKFSCNFRSFCFYFICHLPHPKKIHGQKRNVYHQISGSRELFPWKFSQGFLSMLAWKITEKTIENFPGPPKYDYKHWANLLPPIRIKTDISKNLYLEIRHTADW